ncbi:MAG: hypothetical protein JWN24_2354 [Phycisphaerales bacterium]|nr:hypothetical protein [Phycisphaerales bacterium]
MGGTYAASLAYFQPRVSPELDVTFAAPEAGDDVAGLH